MNGLTNPKKRNCLLPSGCKDLGDVLKSKPKKQVEVPSKKTAGLHPISTEHVFINGKIPVSEVSVCDEAGHVVGTFSLREALALAESRSLDLVLVNAKAKPPLCVLIDYGKYRYQQSKMKKRKSPAA